MKYIIILILLTPFALFAQTNEQTIEKKTFAVGVVPQYAIVNGIRIDLDYRLKTKNQWLVFAPQIYISSKPNLDWEYNSMLGAGIEFQHKIFVKDSELPEGFYFAYGPTFNFFSVKEDGLVPTKFDEKQGKYMSLAKKEMSTNIFKVGANVIIGFQYLKRKSFYIDPYVGTGIRLGFDNRSKGLNESYNEWWADLGYSGIMLVAGVRLGFAL